MTEDFPQGEVPPGRYAQGARSPIVWVWLCATCAGFPVADEDDYQGGLLGSCGGCGAFSMELHRFRAYIDSASGCSCDTHGDPVRGDLTAVTMTPKRIPIPMHSIDLVGRTDGGRDTPVRSNEEAAALALEVFRASDLYDEIATLRQELAERPTAAEYHAMHDHALAKEAEVADLHAEIEKLLRDRTDRERSDPLTCAACVAHYDANPSLVGAVASVGISHGVSTLAALRRYFAAFHRNGHKENP